MTQYGTVELVGHNITWPARSFACDYTQWDADVSCGDLGGDSMDKILTGPSPGLSNVPRIRCWNSDGAALTAIDQVDSNGSDPGAMTHGVKPAGLRAGRR